MKIQYRSYKSIRSVPIPIRYALEAELNGGPRAMMQQWVRDSLKDRKSYAHEWQRIVVAYDGKAPIGWGFLGPDCFHRSGRDTMIGMYVDPAYRRKGIGTTLADKLTTATDIRQVGAKYGVYWQTDTCDGNSGIRCLNRIRAKRNA